MSHYGSEIGCMSNLISSFDQMSTVRFKQQSMVLATHDILLTKLGRNTAKLLYLSNQHERRPIYTCPTLLCSATVFCIPPQHQLLTISWFLSQPGIQGEYSGFGPNSELRDLSLDSTPNSHTLLLQLIICKCELVNKAMGLTPRECMN